MKRLIMVSLAITGGLSGCSFDGVQSVPLPGSVGTGDDAYQLTVELPDVGTLVENAEVKVDDVAVGTVTDLSVDDWHAKAKVSIEEGTQLPSDAVAKVAYNSLLGAAYLELAEPTTRRSERADTVLLNDGDTIPLDHSGAYPSTEQVLAATSVVLNGSGLQQLRTITVELNRALASRAGSGVRQLIPRLNSFVGALNAQRGDITTALDRLDRLSTKFAGDIDVVDTALDDLEPALRVLSRQRSNLTSALTSLDRLSTVSTRLVSLAKDDLRANLEDLAPVLSALDQSGDAVVRGLRYLLTPPFAPETIPNACRGDYCNLFLTLDLSTRALLENFGAAPSPGSAGGGPLNLPGVPNLPGLSNLPSLPAPPLVGSLLDTFGLGVGRTGATQ
jgi:phospholipid/cholesterol/gamma-HCH transport system substrate-binding protein